MSQLNTSELDAAIQGLGSALGEIINRALTVEDMRMQSLSSVEFQADDKGVYGKGLKWSGAGNNKQLIYRANPDRIWTDESIDIGAEQAYMIGNSPVLRAGELSASVRTSSLVKVGTLQNLKTQGNLTIDDYIFYNSDTESLAIGTEAPNGKFAVATLDAEFIIDTEPGKAKLGTWTADGLSLITDDTERLTVHSNGNIELGHSARPITTTVHGRLGIGVNNMDSDISLATSGAIKIDGKRITNAIKEPTSGTYKQGDLVYNNNPVPTGYVGWVCIRSGTPGEWKPFGQISS